MYFIYIILFFNYNLIAWMRVYYHWRNGTVTQTEIIVTIIATLITAASGIVAAIITRGGNKRDVAKTLDKITDWIDDPNKGGVSKERTLLDKTGEIREETRLISKTTEHIFQNTNQLANNLRYESDKIHSMVINGQKADDTVAAIRKAFQDLADAKITEQSLNGQIQALQERVIRLQQDYDKLLAEHEALLEQFHQFADSQSPSENEQEL